MEVKDNTAIIHYQKGTNNLMTKDKYGYIKGFAVAGTNKKFYWAKAFIKDNKVYVSCNEVANPIAVRYAWSDNPGTIDLYNKSGLPAVPFRTDNWTPSTSGKVFSENPWEF